MNKRSLISLSISFLMTASSFAAEVDVSGFISQSVVISDENPFYGEETGTNFNLREVGLNGSWQANDSVRVTGQVLSRKAGSLSDGKPEIDLLLVDKNLVNNQDLNLGVRLGRVKNKVGLYNTVRDVPHARPGVFVPQSIYFESLRDALHSSDGASIYLSANNKLGELKIELLKGESQIDNSQLIESQVFSQDVPGDFEKADVELINVELIPAISPNTLIGLTYLDATNLDFVGGPSITPELINEVINGRLRPPVGSISSKLNLLSIQHSVNKWIISLEYLRADNDVSFGQLPIPDDSSQLEAYYAQAEWQVLDNLSLLGRVEALYYDKDDKDGAQFEALTGQTRLSQFSKGVTLGARYYITPDLSLTGEFSKLKGSALINGHGAIDSSKLKEDWDTFILQLSYHF